MLGKVLGAAKDMAGGVIGGAAGLIGVVGQAINNAKTTEAESAELEKLQSLQEKVAQPDFDTSMLAPEELELVYNYEPQAASFIEETYPDLVEKSQEAKQGTQAQLSALDRFGQMAETGEDAGLIAAREGAEREAMQGFSRAQAEQESQAMRRGLGLGSGAQLAMQQANQASLGAQQQAANEQAAADAALRRMDASSRQAQFGSALTGQELDLAGRNADFVNAFNARQAQRRQQVENQNTQAENDAARRRAEIEQELRTKSQEATQDERERQQREKNLAAQRQFQNQSTTFGQQQGVSDRRLDAIGRRSGRVARTISGGVKAASALGGAGASAMKDY